MRITSAEARLRGYDPAEVARIKLAEEANREAAELILLIDQAFVSIPKPRITLRVAHALDDEWIVSDERMAELAKQDPEMDWREVSEEKTSRCQVYFSFGDSPGMRFYLPAFLIHFLREFPDYGHDEVYRACVDRTLLDALTEDELAVVDKFVAICQKYDVK
jgi:hypothetical protein